TLLARPLFSHRFLPHKGQDHWSRSTPAAAGINTELGPGSLRRQPKLNLWKTRLVHFVSADWLYVIRKNAPERPIFRLSVCCHWVWTISLRVGGQYCGAPPRNTLKPAPIGPFEKYRIIPIGGTQRRGVSIKITPTRRRRKAGIGYLPLNGRSLPLPILGVFFYQNHFSLLLVLRNLNVSALVSNRRAAQICVKSGLQRCDRHAFLFVERQCHI